MENLVLEIRSILIQTTAIFIGLVVWKIILGITIDIIVRKAILNQKLSQMATKIEKEVEKEKEFRDWMNQKLQLQNPDQDGQGFIF